MIDSPTASSARGQSNRGHSGGSKSLHRGRVPLGLASLLVVVVLPAGGRVFLLLPD
jgi:hypothetical protein